MKLVTLASKYLLLFDQSIIYINFFHYYIDIIVITKQTANFATCCIVLLYNLAPSKLHDMQFARYSNLTTLFFNSIYNKRLSGAITKNQFANYAN